MRKRLKENFWLVKLNDILFYHKSEMFVNNPSFYKIDRTRPCLIVALASADVGI